MALDYLANITKDYGIDMEDKAFFGTILAMFALLTGNPFLALIIVLICYF